MQKTNAEMKKEFFEKGGKVTYCPSPWEMKGYTDIMAENARDKCALRRQKKHRPTCEGCLFVLGGRCQLKVSRPSVFHAKTDFQAEYWGNRCDYHSETKKQMNANRKKYTKEIIG